MKYDSAQVLAVRILFSWESECGSFQSNLESMIRISSPDDLIIDSTKQLILWENANLSCFHGGFKEKKCHLMSQTSYIQHGHLIMPITNILIMSAENHDRFDSYSPKIAIRWEEAEEITSSRTAVIIKGVELVCCSIAIECLNAEVFKCIGNSIKTGTRSDADKLTYFTSVAVPNPTQFKQFLTFKYLETRGLQNSDDSEAVLAKISRVRETVKLIMEQDPNFDIDLNLQHKNKRNFVALGIDIVV
eukprot:gene8676-11723_t